MEIDPDKLETLFAERYEKLEGVLRRRLGRGLPSYEHWIDYCDEHKIEILHPEWLRETINQGVGDRICIHNPEDSEGPVWLLVPKEFAAKCLALGGLL